MSGPRVKYFRSNKELAAALNSNPRFVRDMTKGGFQMPATLAEAIAFLRRRPHPSRFRK